MGSVAKQNYLSELRELDWDFTGSSGSDGLAGFHWYPARFVPQVPGILMGYFTAPGDTVLDPFCGSGTTLVEARRLARNGLGIDTNPVATLIADAKCKVVDSGRMAEYADGVMSEVSAKLGLRLEATFVDGPNRAENLLWYHIDTYRELATIWEVVCNTAEPYRTIALACFSSILRFASSQTNHWGWICDNVWPKTFVYRDAISLFEQKLREYCAAVENYGGVEAESAATIDVVAGDCGEVLAKVPDRSFDALITSPPYFGVTDYARSQRLTYLWLDFDLEESRARESGARYKRRRKSALRDFLMELELSFVEIARVLKRNALCGIVLGESKHREGYVEQFCKVIESIGFSIEDSIDRSLPIQRTMSPRIQTERILICRNEFHV